MGDACAAELAAGARPALAPERRLVVAPPRTLADLRDAFHADVKACVIAEIHKDLSAEAVFAQIHPVAEL